MRSPDGPPSSARARGRGGKAGSPGAAEQGASQAPGQERRGIDVTANITYRLLTLTNSLSRSAARDFAAEVGMTVPEWRVLSVVGARGSISLAQLTRILAVDKGWVSRTVVALERRGLVTRSPDPRDVRLFSLNLTADGSALHLRGSKVSRARQQRLEAALEPRGVERLYEALARLQEVADEMEAETGSGSAR